MTCTYTKIGTTVEPVRPLFANANKMLERQRTIPAELTAVSSRRATLTSLRGHAGRTRHGFGLEAMGSRGSTHGQGEANFTLEKVTGAMTYAYSPVIDPDPRVDTPRHLSGIRGRAISRW